MEGVGATGEGFFELPVDAQLFQGRGMAAKRCGQGDRADRAVPKAVNLLISRCRLLTLLA